MDSTLTNGSFNFVVDSQQLEYQKAQIHFAHIECLKIGQKLKVDTNMTCHACLESSTCPQYDVLI